MEALETKKKRLKFLKELQDRGLECGTDQIQRTERAIAFMEFAIILRNRKVERNSKIDSILKK
jgi:hypothetical protein